MKTRPLEPTAFCRRKTELAVAGADLADGRPFLDPNRLEDAIGGDRPLRRPDERDQRRDQDQRQSGANDGGRCHGET